MTTFDWLPPPKPMGGAQYFEDFALGDVFEIRADIDAEKRHDCAGDDGDDEREEVQRPATDAAPPSLKGAARRSRFAISRRAKSRG